MPVKLKSYTTISFISLRLMHQLMISNCFFVKGVLEKALQYVERESLFKIKDEMHT